MHAVDRHEQVGRALDVVDECAHRELDAEVDKSREPVAGCRHARRARATIHREHTLDRVIVAVDGPSVAIEERLCGSKFTLTVWSRQLPRATMRFRSVSDASAELLAALHSSHE